MTPYGTPDPLGVEPGAPVPVVQKPPRRTAEIVGATVASVASATAGGSIAALLIAHDALGYAVISLLIGLIGAAKIAVGDSDTEEAAPPPAPRTEREQIIDLIGSGMLSVEDAERLLSTTPADRQI